jgi:eukaryotic-like serine/threonine-protein kinase
MQRASSARVRLGNFELHLISGELSNGDGKVLLQQQPLQILRMLIERDGEPVTRDEIKSKLWPNDTIVEFDQSINAVIRNLRKALGDSADQPTYIETLARRGYRLKVAVEWIADPANEVSAPGPDPPLRQQPDSNLIGQKVAHYRVLEVIGGGGMGMVYKAEDLKLGREVALKFLPPELATDEVALQRFEREAQAASSLDHPNICTIHAVEEHNGQPFLVMQLLHGQTLRDRLGALAADHKTLPLAELLNIAQQICEGLQAAHAKGIIHRDIKPANIFLTDKEAVKILDFGLAKAVSAIEQPEVDELPAEPSAEATAARPAKSLDTTLTRFGVALGTAGYMSPEQVRGEKLDARTDIFSFGLVIYEMATGQRAFHGETAAVVHNAILHADPVPARQLNPGIPGQLEAAISKALEKDRELRCQSAADFSHELARVRIRAEAQSGAAKWKRRAAWLAAAVLLVTIAVAIARSIKPKPVQGRAVREQQLTANPLDNPLTGAAISPDGKYVAYYDMTGLYLRPVDSGESRPISLPANVGGRLHLCWLPDGRNLLADAIGADSWSIWLIPVAGPSQPKLLYKHAVFPAASPDGRSIAFLGYEGMARVGTEVWVGDTAGGTPRKVIGAAENEHLYVPSWSPDGRWIAYGRKWKGPDGSWHSAIEAVPAVGGPPRTLVAESSVSSVNTSQLLGGIVFTLGWSPDWRLLFSVYSGQQPLLTEVKCGLWQAQIDPSTLDLVGKPQPLIGASSLEVSFLTMAADGKRATMVKSRSWIDIYVGELGADGSRMQTPVRLTQDVRGSILDGWTRDSQAILLDSDRSGKREIFQQRPGDRFAQSILRTDQNALSAQTTPDGKWLLYESDDASGKITSIMRHPSEGGAPENVIDLSHEDLDAFWCSWNANAETPCVLALSNGHELVFYWLDPIRGKGARLGSIEVTESPGSIFNWGLSPDGSTLAAVDARYGARIKLLSLRDRTWRDLPVQTNDTRVYSIAWAADSKSFYICSQSGDSYNLQHVSPDGKTHQLLRTRLRGVTSPVASPDGKYLAFQIQEYDNNVWMIENF